jgi:predicted phosphate transport protein (TIGR00153 family)
VRFRLLPRDEGFYPLFSEAAENLAEAARRFRELIDDVDNAPAHQRRVIECERRGDELMQSLMHRLNSSFVTPFDREDIHALAMQIDDVVDDIQSAAELVVLHAVDKPLPEMRELAEILVDAAEQAVSLVAKLPRLRGTEAETEDIDRLESDADKVYRRSVARLFSGEFKAMDVLKFNDVVEEIEKSVNGIENIADIVETIVLKHA